MLGHDVGVRLARGGEVEHEAEIAPFPVGGGGRGRHGVIAAASAAFPFLKINGILIGHIRLHMYI